MKIKFQGAGQAALLGAIVFLALSGRAYLLEGAEVQQAEIAREMLETGNFVRPLFDFVPAWEKLPLFAWMQALCMQIFGIGTFAVRLPNALASILTLVLLYRLGTLLYNPRFGLWWSAAFISGVLPVFFFSTGIEAAWSSLLLFLSLVYLIFFYWKNERSSIPLRRPVSRYLYLGGLFAGLAAMMRGPETMILLSAVLGVYWLYKNLRFYISVQQFFLFFALAVLPPLIWLSIDGTIHGPDAALAIPGHQWQSFSIAPEGAQKFWGFYFILLLLGCFPASLFALQALAGNRSEFGGDMPDESFEQNDFRRWMKMLLWTILVYYMLRSAKTPEFAFPAIFPLSYLAAWTIHRTLNRGLSLERWVYFALAGAGALLTAWGILQAFPAFPNGIAGIWAPEGGEKGNFSFTLLIPAIILAIGGYFAMKKLHHSASEAGIRQLFIASAAFSLSVLMFVLPPATKEAYGAVVEFAHAKAGEDCYVYPYKFKSYSTLFYARKKHNAHPKSNQQDWLLFGETDKTVYFVARRKDAAELAAYAHIEELYKKDGYVFFERIR